MQTVLFSVADLDRVEEILTHVRQALKPQAIERLYPGAKVAEQATEFFIALDDHVDAEAMARKLRQVPDVANVELPAARKLID